MSNKKTKELIICIVSILILLFVVTTNVFATSSAEDLNALLQNSNKNQITKNSTNTNTNTNSNINTITNNSSTNTNSNANATNTNANTNSNTNTNTNNNTNNLSYKNNTSNTPSSQPNTGIEDWVTPFIVFFAILAIYAYKKVKDYKNV